MRTTPRQIEAAYETASRVFDESMSIEAGAKQLQCEYGLNINSARDYINDYRLMMQGRLFHRTMSAASIDYFLTCILGKRGRSAHSRAISSVEKHIDYYEGLRSLRLKSMRAVVAKHKTQMVGLGDLDAEVSAFSEAITRSIRDSPERRKARLQEAATKPVKLRVVTTTFRRNPDVVAEVLLRAAGLCELCHQPAPFERKIDNSPYLEVHHKKQLAGGGDDTVENAIALCPNCHRKLHFGR